MTPLRVDVVLATYNGERFLRAQLASIAVQTRLPDRLLVADDGSVDRTVEIIEEFAGRSSFPVVLISRVFCGGARANFARLLEASTADLIALCDQDDRWVPDRIERLLATAACAGGGPHLWVHDLAMIDADDRALGSSFWRHQAFETRHGKVFGTLLVMNSFPGCGMFFNRELLQIALPIPEDAVMHDWWLALVAAGCGSISHLGSPLVAYRIHAANTIGAPIQSWWQRLRHGRFGSIQLRREGLRLALKQACTLRRRGLVKDQLRSGLLRRFCSFTHLSAGGRRCVLLRGGIRKTGWLRHLAMLLHP